MGVFDAMTKFNAKAELRESKDEMLCGEIVRAMSRAGYVANRFVAHADRQQMSFRGSRDPVLSNVHITLDRKTGSGMVSSAVAGSKATLRIAGEVKNRLSDPDDVVAMYRTDFANIMRMPVMGQLKLNHELNSVFAHTTIVIEIDDYVLKGPAGTEALMGLIGGHLHSIREALAPYKKGDSV